MLFLFARQIAANDRKCQRCKPHVFKSFQTLANDADDVHRTTHVKREPQNGHQVISYAQAVISHRRTSRQQSEANTKQKRFVSERWYPRHHVGSWKQNTRHQIFDHSHRHIKQNMSCCNDRPFGEPTFSKKCPFPNCSHIQYRHASEWVQHIVRAHPKYWFECIKYCPELGVHMRHMLLRTSSCRECGIWVPLGECPDAADSQTHRQAGTKRIRENDSDTAFETGVAELCTLQAKRSNISQEAEVDD